MNQPTTNLNRFQVKKTRKDAPLKEAVERVRTLLNDSRKDAGFKPLTYMATFMALKRKGYTTPDKVHTLVENCRDALNPVKTLGWKIFKKDV